MNEFEKNQDQGEQPGEQGGKPAFGQFDTEKGEGQQDQQELGQKGEQIPEGQQQEQGEAKKDELAGTGQQGDDQFRNEKGQDDQQR